MAQRPMADVILGEARGAHEVSKEILGLMQDGGEDDPIKGILTLLQRLLDGQQAIMTRLDIIERRLAAKE